MHDVSCFDDFAEAYAADPDFADDDKTADFAFAAGLWLKGDCTVVSNLQTPNGSSFKLSMITQWLAIMASPRP